MQRSLHPETAQAVLVIAVAATCTFGPTVYTSFVSVTHDSFEALCSVAFIPMCIATVTRTTCFGSGCDCAKLYRKSCSMCSASLSAGRPAPIFDMLRDAYCITQYSFVDRGDLTPMSIYSCQADFGGR